MSVKQKLNTDSSTTAELVAVHQGLPMVLWVPLFLEAQGYSVDKNIVYQDNQSAILLEKNGKKSSSRCTRHLNIRYFMVRNCVERGLQTDLKINLAGVALALDLIEEIETMRERLHRFEKDDSI